MPLQDFRSLDQGTSISTDICIIGSGPAGWTIAEELRETGLRILVLESGGVLESGRGDLDLESEALNKTEDVGAPLFNGRRRTLGGTPESDPWGNRCIAFDDIDYESRPWVPYSGWPFGKETINLYLDRASEYLGVGSYFASKIARQPQLPEMLRPQFDPNCLEFIWWGHGEGEDGGTVKFARLFRKRSHPNVRVLVHATVVHLNTNAAGNHVDSVEISDPDGKRAVVRSRVFVLCAGGIENARILLYSNRVFPMGLGNTHDLVGRYLMDHPRDLNMTLTIDPKQYDKIWRCFGPYMFDNGCGPRRFLGGVRLSPAIQRREQLLNCVAWPIEEVSEDDPTRAVARLVKGKSADQLKDLALAAWGSPQILQAAGSYFFSKQPIRRKCAKVGFLITSEQCPNPESRVTLSRQLDRFGLPIAKTDWKISHLDRRSQAVLARTIEKEFQRLGLPKLQLADWITRNELEAGRLSDGCHPTGTTRMSRDSQLGVVDTDCRLHGVDGLYIAGSSVFPTSGHANPTLLIVAMAARLAEQLRARLLRAAHDRVSLAPSLSDSLIGQTEPINVKSVPAKDRAVHNMPTHSDAAEHSAETRTVVAVTGATGFIGGRLVERLVEQGADVTCLVRGEPGPRLQRVGVKLCKIDIANEDAVRVALNRVDWLFHCAYDSEDIEWNYRAVRALIASCHENKLRRFIHVSSFVVYDLPAEGELTEETIETTAKSGYAHVKRQLEVELLSAERREHLPVTILQPTIVYGPFSKPWTIDPVNMLVNGTVVLPDRGEGICNAVYVDDVVEAMIRAARKPSAAGRRYLVSGEPVTWSQFYEAVAEAADARPPIYMPTEMILRRNARVARLLRQLTSPWPLARRIAQQKIIRGILQDGAKVLPAYHRARVLAQLFGPPALRLDYVHLPDRGHLEFLRSSFTVNLTKARREIDYAPRHSFSGGMAKTAVYIKNYLGREREKHGI